VYASLVTLPLEHPLASEKQISISKLKTESFVQVPESVGPDITKECPVLPAIWQFRPRFVSIGVGNSLEEGLVISANEGAVSLQPSFISHLRIPNVVDGSDRRKASHVGFIHRMAKRENVQPFACLAGQFSNSRPSLKRTGGAVPDEGSPRP